MSFHRALPLALSSVLVAVPALASQELPAPKTEPVPSDLPIQSSVWKAVRLSRALTPAQLRSMLGGSYVGISPDGLIHVELVGPKGEPALTPAALAAFGARVEGGWRNHLDLWLPLDQVEACARSLPAGYKIQRASPGEPDDVAGEGPGAIGSDDFRDGGADGSGMTIAVIDGGFDGLTEARANGDAPTTGNTTQLNYATGVFESGGEHGTGCVEAAFDHCPGATWRLYKTNSSTDIGTAVDDCIANGVDVITMSLSKYNEGWEDNTGIPCEAATLAAENGILFFVSAGNRGQQHWQGDFNPGGSLADWHDFAPGDETNTVTVAAGDAISVFLAWDTAGGTFNYDLYILDSSFAAVESSTSAGNEYEYAYYENTSSSTETIHLAVWRASGGVTEFELFGHAHGVNTWERFVSESSTTSPSNTSNQSVISVAAVDWDAFDLANPSAKNYSGQGPTNSGMTVPDLAGPTDTTGFTYATFTGTSCATPNTAGAACALWSALPEYSNSEITQLLYDMAAANRDWGSAGNDNTFGFGGVFVDPQAVRDLSDPPVIFVEQRPFSFQLGTFTQPYLTLQAALGVAPSGAILMIRGDIYLETPLSTQNLRLVTWDGDTVIR